MQFSPAIRPQLHALIDELDDGEHGIAEIWRELGYLARARRLLQPSYESVRRIVHDLREQRRLAYSRAKRAAILTAEFLWNTRNRKGIVLDIADGADIERRRAQYQRRRRKRRRASRPPGAA
jgi:hypothetical protein